jgi:hypothetical protein
MLGRFTNKPLELVPSPKLPHQIELRTRAQCAALVRFMPDIFSTLIFR